MQYRSQIFQLQLAAPAVAILILQHLSEGKILSVLIPIAASWLLLLSLYALTELHRAMIRQVGYLRCVLKSPWERALHSFRKRNRVRDRNLAAGRLRTCACHIRRAIIGLPQWIAGVSDRNPAAGRLGTFAFLIHTAIIALALWIARAATLERYPDQLGWADGQALVVLVSWLGIAYRFVFGLRKYRNKVDKAWDKFSDNGSFVPSILSNG